MSPDPVHKAMRGVVRVYARGFNEGDVRSILDPRFLVPEEWVASGFFFQVQGNEGYILTNGHVVRNAMQLEIMSILTSDELFRVEIVGLVSSLEPDIALLKLPAPELKRFLKIAKIRKLPFLKPFRTEKVRRGQPIKAIGYPLGMAEPNISGGEISNFISGSDQIMERLVTDAAINPGNSGGPSVTPQGRVVGINTAMAVPAANIGFITPIYMIYTVLSEFLNKGEAKTPLLGIHFQKNSDSNRNFLGMKMTEGVIVTEVQKRSFAEKLGLRHADVIKGINNYKLDRHGNVRFEAGFRKRSLYDILHSIPQSKPVVMHIFRKRKNLTLKAKRVDWEWSYFPSQPLISRRRFLYFSGMVIQELSDEIILALSALVDLDEIRSYKFYVEKKWRLIVTHIGSGTFAEEMGIEQGDMIALVQGHHVKSLEDFAKIVTNLLMNKSESILLDFASGALASIPTKNLRSSEIQIQKISALQNDTKF